MITEQQMEEAVYARFPGSDTISSACRGAWRYGANWAIEQMQAENADDAMHNRAQVAALKQIIEGEQAANARLRDALQDLYDEQNGAPLERRRAEWEKAMLKARNALK